MISPQSAFGDYQLEIYGAGLRGVIPEFPMGFAELEARAAQALLESDQFEYLLSEKQLALWNWAQGLAGGEFSRGDAIEALGIAPKTVEQIIKKLFDMKKLEQLGQGRATRYRMR